MVYILDPALYLVDHAAIVLYLGGPKNDIAISYNDDLAIVGF